MAEKMEPCRLCEENWHSFDIQRIYKELESSFGGLDEREAASRLEFYGGNVLPGKKAPSIWMILFHQVINPLIFILIAAGIASLLVGESTDALFIFIVIVFNSLLGAYQEYNAEKSAESLQRMLKIKARVRREDKEKVIASEEVVPGDIVLLESGDKVPADLRLIEANGLTADESFLTGESMAAEKFSEVMEEDVAVSQRRNMAFAGATITSGRATGIVVGTGMETQVGLIAETVTESQGGKPPLVHRMERFTRHIAVLVVFVSIGVAILLRYRGYEWVSIFFLTVALAVSAIPEGLPVALTVALSIASRRMSKRNVIVRKLAAVESLGSCTIIASDKTGTLTVNQQTVRRIVLPDERNFTVSGEGYNGLGEVNAVEQDGIDEASKHRLEKLAEYSIMANEGTLVKENETWEHRGDAMDVAFLAMGYKLGMNSQRMREDFELLGQIPYESKRKYSAAFYEKEGKVYVAVKGAVETLLEFCTSMEMGEETADLDRGRIEQQSQEMAQSGLRVLAVAGGECGAFERKDQYEAGDLGGLIFHGLVGFIDPLRPEAAGAVRECKEAGIKVIMITGDHPATAGAIAKTLELTDGEEAVVTGDQLRQSGTPDSPAYEKLVLSTHVFARVSPDQKYRIIDVLIRGGEFVAVTGDGVNDAPALRRANIGVAMGSGTDVAKEVGSLIVVDDNFASIVSGVEEGRFAYDNVRKVIYLLVSTGAAEVLIFVGAVVVGMPVPFLAVQLLWLNLVTNGIQDIGLAFEGGEAGAMKRPPRKPNEKIFDSLMISETLVSGLAISALAFGSWYWHLRIMDEASARNAVLLLLILLQNVHVLNARSEYESVFKIPLSRNYVLIAGIILAQGLHILSMHIPFMQKLLGVEPVSFGEWFVTLLMALSILGVMEVFKWIRGGRGN